MGKYHILVVDDTRAIRTSLKRVLVEVGFEVSEAASGEECLELTGAGLLPDLILLDVNMGGVDGFATCRALKERAASADIPVVFLSAEEDTESILAGFEAGGHDYILKSADRQVTIARIKSILTTQSLAQDKANLLKINKALLNNIRNMFEGEDLSLFDKLEGMKKEISSASLKIFSYIDIFRLKTEDEELHDLLDEFEIFLQCADKMHQRANEVSKVVHRIYASLVENGQESKNAHEIEKQSSESVFHGKPDQGAVDDLLSSLGL